MFKTTPFYPRTSALNKTMLWENWAGYLVARKYQHSVTHEYYATRNSAGIFDTSPLFKYQIKGKDATAFLAGVLTRDIRKCKTNEAQYTIWSDDNGWIIEDGVVLHVADDEYWLTAAEPNLRYFQRLVGYRQDVTITDITEQYGILALQGPQSLNILKQLTPDAQSLSYFALTHTTIADKQVVLSRTGYTGDLGYELWIRSEDAVAVWDALMETGKGYNITPFGQQVLHIARIDAGLMLIGIEFETARHAWTDEQRSNPIELGFGWMIPRKETELRHFIGGKAIRRMKAEKSVRWKMVGIELDWRSYEETYNNLGLIAPKDILPIEEAMSLYDQDRKWMGHTTSFVYSSVLKKHIAIAKLTPEMAKIGTALSLELMINNRPRLVQVKVVKMPFYNPDRKTADHTKGN